MKRLPNRYHFVLNEDRLAGEVPVYDITYRYEEEDYHLYVYACKGETVEFGPRPSIKKEDVQKIEHLKAKHKDAEDELNTRIAGAVLSFISFVGLLIGGLITIARKTTTDAGIIFLTISAVSGVLLVLFICLAVSANKNCEALVAEIKAYLKEREDRRKRVYEEKIKELGGNL